MIYNREFLFIHVPKTGGMSITKALSHKLEQPVYATAPEGHISGGEGFNMLKGRRHETLKNARFFLGKRNMLLNDFKLIISVIRNPYDLELSRYHYLRKAYPHDNGEMQKMALENDFDYFALNSTWWFNDISEFYCLDEKIPQNLKIIRFENLNNELTDLLKMEMSIDLDLPVTNTSERPKSFEISNLAEQAIFNKYNWIFRNNFYQRLVL